MEDWDAYREWWHRFYSFKVADNRCTTLKEAREALYLSTKTVGERLGISRQAYLQLEGSDLAGTISVNNLRRCAAVLGCALIHELKPKTPFSMQIWEVLVKAVYRPRTQSALAWRVHDKMFDPWLRRAQGWSKNSEQQSHYVARSHQRTRPNFNDPTIQWNR